MLDLRSLPETSRHLLSLLAFSAPSTPPTFVVLLDSDIADTDLNVFAPLLKGENEQMLAALALGLPYVRIDPVV